MSFENEDDRTSYSKYYTPKGQIKEFDELIDGKSFFDPPIKSKEEIYKKNIKLSKNNVRTTSNLLDHEYFPKHKLIATDLSK